MMTKAQMIGLLSAMSGTSFPSPASPIQTLVYDGQSLALINGISTRPDNIRAARIDPAGVLMVKGLRNTAGQAVALQGPQGASYDTAVPATGYGPAVVEGNWTMAFWTAHALRRWRARLGLPNPRILTGSTAQGGMSVLEFDDDQPAATGTQGPRLIANMRHWLSQTRAILGGLAGDVPYEIFTQGEADANMAEAAYYAAFIKTRRDRLRVISEETGCAAIPCTTQIGSYTNGTVATYGVKLAQIRATIDLGGIVLPPWYPVVLTDNNVHPDVVGSRGIADLIGYHLTRHEAGRPIPPFIPATRVTGNQIVLDYSGGLGPGDFLTFDGAGKYQPYGGVENQGFEVSGTTLTGVEIGADGRSVVLTCAAAPTGWSYAMQSRNVTSHAVGQMNYPAHRGLLRKERAIKGVLGDEPLHEWALSWREAGL